MSYKNDFKAFSIDNNANVVSQGIYEEEQSLKTGFPPDNVPTHVLNKTLRQSSIISSVLADFISTQSGEDVLDDGDIAKLTAQLNRALEQKTTTKVPDASLTQKGVVQLTNVIGNSDTLAVTQKIVQEIINSLREDINNRVFNSRKVNGKALSTDISLNAVDIGALPSNGTAIAANKLVTARTIAGVAFDGTANINIPAGNVGAYTKAEVNNLINTVNNIPVGVPVPWPTAIPPTGWLQCNGAAFNKSKFPKLVAAYPSGVLPDLRGEFIRGWDSSRGADSGRVLLSWQEGSALAQYVEYYTGGLGHDILYGDGIVYNGPKTRRYNSSILGIIGHGTNYLRLRPRNIAFNYIVRAA